MQEKVNLSKKALIGIIAGAVIMFAVIVGLVLFIFVGRNHDNKIKNGPDVSQTQTNIFTKKADNLNIVQSEAKQIKLVDYDGGNFTMKIPEGWTVTTGGTEMYYAIRIQDPKDERNQIFTVLKAAPFLKSYDAKKFQEGYVNMTGNQTYKMFSEAIILNDATTEDFYLNFNNYANYIKKFEPTYSNFNFPFLSVFTKLEEFESNTYMKSVSLDDKTIRATFEDSNGKPAEGLFMASVVNLNSYYVGNIDAGFYYVYNVIFITSAKDEFINYKDILSESLSTLAYKDSFVNATNSAIQERTDATLKANATVQAAYDSYNSAWNARQKTYDITSQKYSDATLGYERVYDTDTGEIYKAYNGFTDDYQGKRYQAITDDMYTQSIAGYIEK